MSFDVNSFDPQTLRHADGSLFSRIEAEQWFRHHLERLEWRLLARRRYGLEHKHIFDALHITALHMLLDAMVARGELAGEVLGVQPGVDSEGPELEKFKQRLAAFIASGQAMIPEEGDGIDMTDINKFNPPPVGMPNGIPGAPQQGFAPGAAPPGVQGQFPQVPSFPAPPGMAPPGMPPQMAPQMPQQMQPQAPQQMPQQMQPLQGFTPQPQPPGMPQPPAGFPAPGAPQPGYPAGYPAQGMLPQMPQGMPGPQFAQAPGAPPAQPQQMQLPVQPQAQQPQGQPAAEAPRGRRSRKNDSQAAAQPPQTQAAPQGIPQQQPQFAQAPQQFAQPPQGIPQGMAVQPFSVVQPSPAPQPQQPTLSIAPDPRIDQLLAVVSSLAQRVAAMDYVLSLIMLGGLNPQYDPHAQLGSENALKARGYPLPPQ